jgi:elongation factor P--(R)-beta-lysine ligase
MPAHQFLRKTLMSSASNWWNPSTHADRRPMLLARGRIKTAIRAWFETQGFIEVETSCLQVSPGNETHLHAFKTELIGTDLERHDLYLHTSPEFAMKKLLAAGEEKIFTFAPAFRNRECGALHSPEFTMLEWYRAGATYETLWDDCAALLKVAAETTGHTSWTYRGKTCAPGKHYDWLTLNQAFAEFAGFELHETYSATSTDRDALARRAQAGGIAFGEDDTWADIFSRVLTEKIEPELGSKRPEILCEYPVHEAALARLHPDDHKVAERFELYVCGVELANGFGELNDPTEQRRRFEKWMDDKQRIYGERYPIDEDFLSALEHMPPAAGCALGFDRLVMLATGADRIDQVIWTPLAEGSKHST